MTPEDFARRLFDCYQAELERELGVDAESLMRWEDFTETNKRLLIAAVRAAVRAALAKEMREP